MGFGSRKFTIWVVSLTLVFAIYILYSRISRTPRIGAEKVDSTIDVNSGEAGELGKVGKVGVGTVQNARYTHLNKNKEIDREFGFRKLLYESGDEWETEKPFINIFQHNFKCYITADRGNVVIDTAGGKPAPKDATLTSNVVIHIVPEEADKANEGFIYLDNVVFISEKSQFSSEGPIRFVSRNAQMLGKGFELVYNDELNRMEFLKITHLDNIHLQTPAASLLSSNQPAAGEKQTQTNETPKKAQEAEKPSTTGEKKEGYKCILRKNVVINSPEQLIRADEVSIRNIMQPKASETKTAGTDLPSGGEVPATKSNEPNKPAEKTMDIIVTCDGGIIVTPVGSSATFEENTAGAAADNSNVQKDFNEVGGKTTFVAQNIDYDISTGDVIATGQSELKFYADDVMAEGHSGKAVPVKITARQKVQFLRAANQAVFEGDCISAMLRSDVNAVQEKYTLSAPKLLVYLSGGKTSSGGIKHLTAEGGSVKLATVKTAGQKFLGGLELKCRKFDYDTDEQILLASGGPGVIKVDNSKVPAPQKSAKAGRFSLRRPCYAFLRYFEDLRYSLKTKRIVANAKSQVLLLDYFPVAAGKEGPQVAVSAGHIEAALAQTAGGQTELMTLAATEGITYEDADKQFAGSEMFYDVNKSLITARGNKSQPCLLNGALVNGIEYNLKTDRVKTAISGAGALQLGR